MRAVRSVVVGSLCALFFVSAYTHAQVLATAEGPPLTLQAALAEALERNPALLALKRASETATTRPAIEKSLMPPMLETQIWQWPIDTINPGNANMYMFTVGQELPGKGKRDLRAALMEKDAQMAEADIAVKLRDVVGDVKRVYAVLFVARQSITIYESNLELMRQFTDISQAKYEAGRISQQDVLKSIVEISRMYEDIVELKEQARMAEAELNALLDRPTDGPIGELAEPREAVELPPVAALQARALEAHPDLKVARLAIERAEAALAVGQSDYKPDFRVGGGYMLMPGMRDAWTASFSLTWPKAPWSRKGIDAKLATSRAEIEEARARVRVIENAVRLAVQQAYLRAQSAAERAGLLKTSLMPQSAQIVDVARVAYQTDRVDFLDLLDTQRVLLTAQLDYYRALSQLEQAMADLERAVGEDLTSDTQGRLKPAPTDTGAEGRLKPAPTDPGTGSHGGQR